jgi:hypothetical protein
MRARRPDLDARATGAAMLLRTSSLALLLVAAPAPPRAAPYRVDPDAGNNTFSAVFDAALGERITAQSASVGCELRHDPATGIAAGRCEVPLTSIRVDAEETKTEHFRQWATNRKGDPAACALEARFDGIRVGRLEPGVPAPFAADVPFTVCGRPRADGGPERVTGTALLFPPGEYGSQETIRIRATVERFDREAYRVGPAFTEGWLARVQSLARVVAREGRVELSLFARAAPAQPAAAR